MEQTVQDAPDQQVSLTDPDARSMATSGKGPLPSATTYRSPSLLQAIRV